MEEIPRYQQKSELEEFYVNRNYSLKECGEEFGCGERTVKRWLDKHGIEVDRRGRRKSETVTYGMSGGYCYISANSDTVAVHQLTAIAGGADPYKVFSDDHVVHHLTNIPYDNRPDNLVCVLENVNLGIAQLMNLPNDEMRIGLGILKQTVEEMYPDESWSSFFERAPKETSP